MNANLRNFALWVIIVLLLLALFTLFQNPGQRASSQDISFSQLLTEVDQNHVRDVVIQGPEIHGTFTNGSSFQTYAPNDPTLVSRLYNGKVSITAKPPGDNVPWFVSLLVSWLPFIALIGVWIFLSRQMQGGAGKAMGFGKSRAKMLTEAHGRVTFEDVAGVDEAKQDLQEIVEFLRDPGKFQRLGGRIPRGVLLVGPPGTGKTLIARAVAGEANVPFFTISGSDFVEMFVGVGASRVRDMFEQAKKNAPCIIFIDEIDAVGRHRGAGLGGGNDEREQTLNQLLVEMDGFEANEGVILIAAADAHQIDHATIKSNGTEITWDYQGNHYKTIFRDTFQIEQILRDDKINFNTEAPSSSNLLLSVILPNVILFLVIGGFMWYMLRQTQSGNNQAISFGRSRARCSAATSRP